MPNVVIVTTMWSKVSEEEGTMREEVLKREVWNEMPNSGCRTERFEDTCESAWKIVGSMDTTGIELRETSTLSVPSPSVMGPIDDSSSSNMQISRRDRIVLAMDPTGAGKSNFIECATF